MSLQTRKRKISKVTNAFRKTVAIALDKPAFGQSSDCLNCCWMVKLIKERLAVTEDRREIIQLSTIVPCDLSISKVAEIFNVSEYTARQARQLRVQKGIVSIPEWIQRVGISRETKQLFLYFMRVKKSVVYSQGRRIVLVFNFQIKQRWRNRNSIFHLTFQRFMYSLKRKILTGKLAFHCLHSYIQSGASLLLQQVHTTFVFALITKM